MSDIDKVASKYVDVRPSHAQARHVVESMGFEFGALVEQLEADGVTREHAIALVAEHAGRYCAKHLGVMAVTDEPETPESDDDLADY